MSHAVASRLRVAEDVVALLEIHARDTEQEAALKAQCHWRTRVEDGLACPAHVDLEYVLATDFLEGRARSQRRNQPAMMLAFDRCPVEGWGKVPDGCDAMFARSQDCFETLAGLVVFIPW